MITLMLITLMTITLITLIIRVIGAPCLLRTLRSNMDMELHSRLFFRKTCNHPASDANTKNIRAHVYHDLSSTS